MKLHSAPLFLMCFAACAGSDPTADSSDLKQVTKTQTKKELQRVPQPKTDPDDDQLLADGRQTVLAPSGAPTGPTAFVGLFADGQGEWALGSDARSTELAQSQIVRYTRRCNTFPTCTAWAPEEVTLLTSFTLNISDAGDLSLTQRDLDGNVLTEAPLPTPKTPVTLVAHDIDNNLDVRRFLVDVRDTTITIETLVNERDLDKENKNKEQYAWSMQFSVPSIADLPARQPSEPEPTATLSATCNTAPATHDELIAWFNGGESELSFPIAENKSWTRNCHALTGCTKWASDDKNKLLDKLVVKAAKVNVESSKGDFFELTDSVYKKDGVDILVGKGCARGTARYSVPTETHNTRQTLAAGVSNRGSSPASN